MAAAAVALWLAVPAGASSAAVTGTEKFKITHKGPSTAHINPKTCLLTITGHGTFKLSGGTGAYAKISGAGTYKLNILAVAAKTATGKCSQTKPPTAFQQIVKASGTVSL